MLRLLQLADGVGAPTFVLIFQRLHSCILPSTIDIFSDVTAVVSLLEAT